MTTSAIDDPKRRLRDLELLVYDNPGILNLRLERIDMAWSELSHRLSLVDRQIATLTRDVREMRAAVTRQLVAQDQRFASIEQKLVALDDRLVAVESRLSSIEKKLVAQDGRLVAVESRLSSIDTKLDAVLAKLGAG